MHSSPDNSRLLPHRSMRQWVRRAVVAVTFRLPYGAFSSMVSTLCHIRLLQPLLFRQRARQVARFGRELGIENVPNFVDRSLAVATFQSWRLFKIARFSEAEFERWIEVRGVERLQEAFQGSGRVVLVNGHCGLLRAVPLILVRLGYRLHCIARKDLYRLMGLELDPDLYVCRGYEEEGTTFTREAHVARKAVLGGRVLHLAGDVVAGINIGNEPFLGRRRSFAQGFASIARITGATVLPILSEIEPDGKLVIRILEPLISDPDSDSYEGDLVSQFARVFDQHIRMYPENLSFSHMRLTLQWPKLEDDEARVEHDKQMPAS